MFCSTDFVSQFLFSNNLFDVMSVDYDILQQRSVSVVLPSHRQLPELLRARASQASGGQPGDATLQAQRKTAAGR